MIQTGGAPRALRENPTTTSIFQSKYHLENLFSKSCREPGIFCSFSTQNLFILRNFRAPIPKWDLWLPPVRRRIGVRIYGQIPSPACLTRSVRKCSVSAAENPKPGITGQAGRDVPAPPAPSAPVGSCLSHLWCPGSAVVTGMALAMRRNHFY